jgi:death-on-curing protein
MEIVVVRLTPDGVRRIHDRILSAGELRGEYEGRLEGALGRLDNRMNYGGIGINDIFDVAGAYAAFITTAHAFTDGNKRTAFRASVAVLGLNGIHPQFVKLPHEGYYDLIIECAQGMRDETHLAEHLRAQFIEFAAAAL